jgi:protein-arginine kinase activator protein McsA
MSRQKHNDIIFLEKRLEDLLDVENYEKAATIARWIRELNELFDKREETINNIAINKK